MTDHPYKTLPDYAFWSRSVSRPASADVDPVVRPTFTLSTEDKIATAGSCFAQHIARHLQKRGFCYYVAEPLHPFADPKLAQAFNYGVFSARYGNIYTARQLLQLWKRAFGEFQPVEDIWTEQDGRCIDPFRPQIQPGGFVNRIEFDADRAQHFDRVRRMFAELDVFVFTLGLTESWVSAEDGAVFPVCPGVSGGVFDPEKHRFVNFTVADVVADLLEFIDRLRSLNPGARVILTVSPVPLVATAEDRHVLVSTTYSKSVLRVAAEEIAAQRDGVAYFPSYEIITGNFSRGRYYAEDLRSVTEEGVNHVMSLFLKHYGGITSAADASTQEAAAEEAYEERVRRMEELAKVNCDEVALDAELSAHA